MSFVIRFDNLDINDIVFTDPKINPKTKKLQSGIISAKTKKTFGIETPNMIAPFGLSVYDPTDGGDPTQASYSLPLRVDYNPNDAESESESAEVKGQRKLIEFMKGLDRKMIDFGIRHSQLIFKKTYADTPANRQVVEALYSSLVKPQVGKDGTVYPDRLNMKLNGNEERSGPDSQILFFKDSSSPIVIESWSHLSELIPKGTQVKAIIQPSIFLIAGKFGLKLKLIQMKVPNVQRVGRPMTYAFSEPPAEIEDVKVEKKKTFDSHVNDSDEEEPEEIEESA